MTTGAELVALLKGVPGGLKAIGKVIGAPANAVAAWFDIATAQGQAFSTNIRAKTDAKQREIECTADAQAREMRAKSEAREKIIAQAGVFAVEQMTSNEDLAHRALAQFAEDLLEKQVNREAVAIKAIDLLHEEPPMHPQREVSPDWLNVFSAFAERASSGTLREHWAAVLAGEIRQPGSVSLMTLHLFSIVDQKSAELISEYANYCFKLEGDNELGIPFSGEFVAEPRYDDLISLDSLGFLTYPHTAHASSVSIGNFRIFRKDSSDVYINAAILTKSGREIVDLIGSSTTDEQARFVFRQIEHNEIFEFALIDAGRE